MGEQKPRATREDVLTTFDDTGKSHVGNRRRPQSAAEIRRAVEAARGTTVPEQPFRALLSEMSRDGTLVQRAGIDWHGLAPSLYDVNSVRQYYTRPDVLAEWEKAVQDADEARAAAEADRYAKELLKIRHPREYDELVDMYRDGARLAE
jgi:hypothetical protein